MSKDLTLDERLVLEQSFDCLMIKAEEALKENPMNMVQYEACLWACTSIIVIEFYLKHVQALLTSDSARDIGFLRLAAGCSDPGAVAMTWGYVENFHEAFKYSSSIFPLIDDRTLLEDVKEVRELADKANVDTVLNACMALDDGAVVFDKTSGQITIDGKQYNYAYIGY